MNFRGKPRTNDTHESSTDPEAKSARKGPGKEAKLSYAGHALMENRNGLCVDLQIRSAIEAEPKAARGASGSAAPQTRASEDPERRQGLSHSRLHREAARSRHPPAHRPDRRPMTPGLDDRTTRHESYRISQRKRKRIEEIFGWLKSYGGLRKTRFIGTARVQMQAYLAGAAYNLLRMSRLQAPTG